jgi:aminomethyltransferase
MRKEAHLFHASSFAGETGACAGAEGETAPETLRQKDRGEKETLESGAAPDGASPTDGRNPQGSKGRAGKSLRSPDRGGADGGTPRLSPYAGESVMTDEPKLESAPLARLPLDALHRRLGARMAPFAGYDMPLQYASGIVSETLHTRQKAGLFDVSHMGQAILAGAGAARALETLVPGDIAGLAPGRTRYTQLLNDKGGILDDLLVTRLPGVEERLLLVVNASRKADDFALMRERLPRFDFLPLNRALIALQGPRAACVLGALLPGAEDLPFMHWRAFEEGVSSFFVSRSGYTGEDGFEISLRADRAEMFVNALLQNPDVAPVGLGARDALRLEAGLPLYGHDLDETTDPVEAGLAWSIGKRRRMEGGFPGFARIDAALRNGPARLRVGLLPQSKAPVREGAVLISESGEVVGHVSSGGFSPTLQRPIAMGYVARPFAAPGVTIFTELRGNRIGVDVAPLPFVAHRYFKPNA